MFQEGKPVETMVQMDYEPVAKEVADFTEELDLDKRGALSDFLCGVKFALNLMARKQAI